MCPPCRTRHRTYGTTKRAKWKAEREAFDREMAGLRVAEDERRRGLGLGVSFYVFFVSFLVSLPKFLLYVSTFVFVCFLLPASFAFHPSSRYFPSFRQMLSCLPVPFSLKNFPSFLRSFVCLRFPSFLQSSAFRPPNRFLSFLPLSAPFAFLPPF